MYRKTESDAYHSSAENRFVYRPPPFRVPEQKPSELSLDQSSEPSNLHDQDVFIRSRTFQNSNWRQPQAWDKPSSHADTTLNLSKKDIAAANSFMPHFCSKKESNYTPTLKAVDNLTPKFLAMDLHNDLTPNFLPQQQKRSSDTSYVRNTQNSWRKPNNAQNYSGGPNHSTGPNHSAGPNHSNLHYNVRRKFLQGSDQELTASEKKLLAKTATISEMLGSKTTFYEVMNELDSKTLKVKMEDLKKEEEAVEHVKAETQTMYPECSVLPYGIRLLGMAHPNSAIYMFFNTGSNYFQASNENKELQTRIRKSVYEIMKTCGHCDNIRDWDVQELVTFTHVHTQMNCVVSFANGFKDQNTLLLKSYLKVDKRLRLLMLMVTDMVYRYHDLSKAFTSYVLNIMVIMFLQRIPQPILPSLMKLRQSFPYEKVLIGGFDCGFPKDFTVPTSNHLSVQELLKQFCAFYRDFNFDEDVVSILGPELKREMFRPPYEGPISAEPLNSYFTSLKEGGNTLKMNCDLPVIVQDPFELHCNSAEKVNKAVLEVFKMMCQDGYNILSKWC